MQSNCNLARNLSLPLVTAAQASQTAAWPTATVRSPPGLTGRWILRNAKKFYCDAAREPGLKGPNGPLSVMSNVNGRLLDLPAPNAIALPWTSL